jgi:HEAT repeats
MVPLRSVWQFNTRSMMAVIALTGLGCGLLVWSWRNVRGPWPRWVHSVHSSADYQATTIASVASVEGRVPGVSPESAVRELISALDDPKDGTRVAAIIALGQAGRRAAKAVPKLLASLRDQPLIEYNAAWALGQIVGQRDAECDAVISALFAAADGPFPGTRVYALVRAYSIQSIARLVEPSGRRRADLDRLLTRSLEDDYPLVRAIAGLELIRVGRGNDARPVLAAIRKVEEGYETSQLGLGLLGSRTADALRSLRIMTRLDSDPWIKKAAHDALGD